MNAPHALLRVAALVIALPGCASKHADGPQPDVMPPPARAAYVASRIAQVGHGATAHFAPCPAPACPVPTLKTFAPLVPQTMPSSAPPAAPEPSASASAAAGAIDGVDP